jgi:hypothetical protein
MNLRRIIAIAYKEALQVWRDPRSLAIALLMPLMQMVLLGYGISLDIKRVPLCLYDQENSQTSREMLADSPTPAGSAPLPYWTATVPCVPRWTRGPASAPWSSP